MKTLYLDIFSGISGDMFIGALLDLGVDAAQFERELEKLGLREYHLHVSRQERGAIAGTKFDVHLTTGPAHSHSHGEGEHSHSHEPGHEHTHGRTFADISKMIARSLLSPRVKEKAIAVFQRVAVAEGKIHGHPPESVHFHEVGAVDSIVDIVGACVAWEMLGRPRVRAAHPIEGTGTIRCAHGTFPIPAPATLEILRARGVTLQQCEEPGELITPTGAAILAEFAESYGPMSGLTVEKIGYGLGTRQNKTRPNVLRAVFGEECEESNVQGPRSKVSGGLDWETDTIAVLETNLDDINAELLGAFVEQALAAGALDVFHTPVQMKKNRPGVLLTVLCADSNADKFSELILRETTAFGVRRTLAERRKLRREMTTVTTKFGEVAVKLGRLGGKVIQAAPEFESCRLAAARASVTVREVYETAVKSLNL